MQLHDLAVFLDLVLMRRCDNGYYFHYFTLKMWLTSRCSGTDAPLCFISIRTPCAPPSAIVTNAHANQPSNSWRYETRNHFPSELPNSGLVLLLTMACITLFKHECTHWRTFWGILLKVKIATLQPQTQRGAFE